MAKRKRELEAVVGPPSTARCNDTRPELGSRKQKGRPKAGGIDHDDGGSRVQVVWELADGSRRWKKRVKCKKNLDEVLPQIAAKLRLSKSQLDHVRLAQIRVGGREVEIDDDYDFQAFKARALASTSLEPLIVKVYPGVPGSDNAVASSSRTNDTSIGTGGPAGKEKEGTRTGGSTAIAFTPGSRSGSAKDGKGKAREIGPASVPGAQPAERLPPIQAPPSLPSRSALAKETVYLSSTAKRKAEKKVQLAVPSDNPPYTPSPAASVTTSRNPTPNTTPNPILPAKTQPNIAKTATANDRSALDPKLVAPSSRPSSGKVLPKAGDVSADVSKPLTVSAKRKRRHDRKTPFPSSSSPNPVVQLPQKKQTKGKSSGSSTADAFSTISKSRISIPVTKDPIVEKAMYSALERYKPARPSPLSKSAESSSGATQVEATHIPESTRLSPDDRRPVPLAPIAQAPAPVLTDQPDQPLAVPSKPPITPGSSYSTPIHLSKVFTLYGKPADPEKTPEHSSSSISKTKRKRSEPKRTSNAASLKGVPHSVRADTVRDQVIELGAGEIEVVPPVPVTAQVRVVDDGGAPPVSMQAVTELSPLEPQRTVPEPVLHTARVLSMAKGAPKGKKFKASRAADSSVTPYEQRPETIASDASLLEETSAPASSVSSIDTSPIVAPPFAVPSGREPGKARSKCPSSEAAAKAIMKRYREKLAATQAVEASKPASPAPIDHISDRSASVAQESETSVLAPGDNANVAHGVLEGSHSTSPPVPSATGMVEVVIIPSDQFTSSAPLITETASPAQSKRTPQKIIEIVSHILEHPPIPHVRSPSKANSSRQAEALSTPDVSFGTETAAAIAHVYPSSSAAVATKGKIRKGQEPVATDTPTSFRRSIHTVPSGNGSQADSISSYRADGTSLATSPRIDLVDSTSDSAAARLPLKKGRQPKKATQPSSQHQSDAEQQEAPMQAPRNNSLGLTQNEVPAEDAAPSMQDVQVIVGQSAYKSSQVASQPEGRASRTTASRATHNDQSAHLPETNESPKDDMPSANVLESSMSPAQQPSSNSISTIHGLDTAPTVETLKGKRKPPTKSRQPPMSGLALPGEELPLIATDKTAQLLNDDVESTAAPPVPHTSLTSRINPKATRSSRPSTDPRLARSPPASDRSTPLPDHARHAVATSPPIRNKNTTTKAEQNRLAHRAACIICGKVPTHLQKNCPRVMAGVESLQQLLEEKAEEDPNESTEASIQMIKAWIERFTKIRNSVIGTGDEPSGPLTLPASSATLQPKQVQGKGKKDTVAPAQVDGPMDSMEGGTRISAPPLQTSSLPHQNGILGIEATDAASALARTPKTAGEHAPPVHPLYLKALSKPRKAGSLSGLSASDAVIETGGSDNDNSSVAGSAEDDGEDGQTSSTSVQSSGDSHYEDDPSSDSNEDIQSSRSEVSESESVPSDQSIRKILTAPLNERQKRAARESAASMLARNLTLDVEEGHSEIEASTSDEEQLIARGGSDSSIGDFGEAEGDNRSSGGSDISAPTQAPAVLAKSNSSSPESRRSSRSFAALDQRAGGSQSANEFDGDLAMREAIEEDDRPEREAMAGVMVDETVPKAANAVKHTIASGLPSPPTSHDNELVPETISIAEEESERSASPPKTTLRPASGSLSPPVDLGRPASGRRLRSASREVPLLAERSHRPRPKRGLRANSSSQGQLGAESPQLTQKSRESVDPSPQTNQRSQRATAASSQRLSASQARTSSRRVTASNETSTGLHLHLNGDSRGKAPAQASQRPTQIRSSQMDELASSQLLQPSPLEDGPDSQPSPPRPKGRTRNSLLFTTQPSQGPATQAYKAIPSSDSLDPPSRTASASRPRTYGRANGTKRLSSPIVEDDGSSPSSSPSPSPSPLLSTEAVGVASSACGDESSLAPSTKIYPPLPRHPSASQPQSSFPSLSSLPKDLLRIGRSVASSAMGTASQPPPLPAVEESEESGTSSSDEENNVPAGMEGRYAGIRRKKVNTGGRMNGW